jgi:hypothetical protein
MPFNRHRRDSLIAARGPIGTIAWPCFQFLPYPSERFRNETASRYLTFSAGQVVA